MSPDPLSRALHVTSTQLRELHIHSLDITDEIFHFVGDETAWPKLEVLELTRIAMATPNGTPLEYAFGYDEDEDPVVLKPSSETGNERPGYIACISDDLSIVPGYFDEMYASAGRAAQKMPKLQKMSLSFGRGKEQDLQLMQCGRARALEFVSIYGYAPCLSVLNAGKIKEGQMQLRGEVLRAEFESWPVS